METPESLTSEQTSPFPANWTPAYIERVGNEVGNAFTDYENAWSQDRERLYRCWEDYNSITKRSVSKLFSNVQLPIVQEIIRVLHSRLWDAVGSANPLILVDPVGQIAPSEAGDYGTMERAAGILQQVENGLYDAGGGRKEAMLLILDGLMYGRMVGVSGWEQIFAEDAQSWYPAMEYPVGKRESPYALMWDPRGSDIQACVRTFRTIHLTEEEAVKRSQMNYFAKDGVDKLNFKSTPYTSASRYRQYEMEARKEQDALASSGVADAVEALLRLDPDKNGKPTMHYVWLDPATNKLLGARPCTYLGGKRPLVVGYLWPASGDHIAGISVVEWLHGLARAKSTLFNQLIDNTKLAQARYLVNKNAYVNEAELKNTQPGGLIHADDISDNGVRPFQATSIGPEILNAMSFLNAEIQQASSVTDISMAMKSASTAYATGILSAQSQSTFDIFASFAKESFFTPLFGQLLNMTQTFLDMKVPATIDVAGIQARVWVNRHDLAGKFMARCADLRIVGKRKADAQVLTTVLATAVQTGAQFDFSEWYRYLLALNDVPAPIIDRLLPQGQPLMPMGTQGGVQGQPNPLGVSPVAGDPGASRLQMRPGVGGEQPDMSAMPALGGGAANG